MTKVDYTVDSVSHGLDLAVGRGDIQFWSVTYSSAAKPRPLFDIESHTGSLRRVNLNEAHGVLFGILAARTGSLGQTASQQASEIERRVADRTEYVQPSGYAPALDDESFRRESWTD